jgi:hypothetical protein
MIASQTEGASIPKSQHEAGIKSVAPPAPRLVTKRTLFSSTSASASSQAKAKVASCNRPISLAQTTTASRGQSLHRDPLRCAGLYMRRFSEVFSKSVCMMSNETVKQGNRLTKVSLLSSNLHKKRIASTRGNEEYYSCTHLRNLSLFPASRNGSWTKDSRERSLDVQHRHVSNHQLEFLAVCLSQCHKHFATQSKPARWMSIRCAVSPSYDRPVSAQGAVVACADTNGEKKD